MTRSSRPGLPAALRNGVACAGACIAACSVGLAAFAAHAGDVADRGTLQLAAVFALGHGIALAALAPRAGRRLGLLALGALLLGTALFAGSLAAARLVDASTSLAPVGGMLLIAGWLLHAIDAWRR